MSSGQASTLDQPARNTQARYNVCPTTIDTVVDSDGKRQLVQMRWGLVPSRWSKPLKELKLAPLNARAETVAEKPFFREAFKRNRCLIPVSGYYEWEDTLSGRMWSLRPQLCTCAGQRTAPRLRTHCLATNCARSGC